MTSGRDLVREWLFEYACRHHMPAVLHEIALHHNSIWTEELWSIPQIFPMMAVVHDVVASGDEAKYSYVLDIITELYELTTSFVEYSIYAKLSVALKILVLFRMLRNSDKMVLPRLYAYFPRSGFHNPNADNSTEKHLNHGQREFRNFFLRLLGNESVKKKFMETEFEIEYGDAFKLRLKELVRQFLNAIETSLPQPVIDLILSSPPDSTLIQELMSSHCTSVEILLDATVGRDVLTEAEVLEVLQDLREDNVSLQMDQFKGLGINLLMSSSGQELENVKNSDLSITGITSNKNRKRKADEKSEDRNGSDNCSLETVEQGHTSYFLRLRKKARVSSGDSDCVEEDESGSASEVQKGRVARLQYNGWTCTGINFIDSRNSIDNRCSKPIESRNDTKDNHRSKPTRDKDSRGLSKGKESLDRECLYSNSASYCPTGPSPLAVLSSLHQCPEIKQCPIAVNLCRQPSTTSVGVCHRAGGADRYPNCQGHSLRSKGDEDDVVEAEDVEPTEESKGDSNDDNCSPLSSESRKEKVWSSVSPLREDAIPDTPLNEQGITTSSHRATIEEVVDDESYVTDSEDLQSYAAAQEEIIPSSYSFDKECNCTAVNGNKMTIFQ